MAQGDLTVTFGGLPYSPLTVTLSKLLVGATRLGVLLGLGLALGFADGAADADVAGADGEAEGDAGSSLPHAASSGDARSPRTITALAGKKRTGKHYPPPPVSWAADGAWLVVLSGMRQVDKS